MTRAQPIHLSTAKTYSHFKHIHVSIPMAAVVSTSQCIIAGKYKVQNSERVYSSIIDDKTRHPTTTLFQANCYLYI